jgi:hypothetical protein
MKVPEIIDGTVIKASDGLLFATRDALLAYRNGVTSAVTAPSSRGFLAGLSAVFSTAAANKLVDGAVIQEVAALHVALSLSSVISVSTQIATLRRLLLGEGDGDLAERFSDVMSVCHLCEISFFIRLTQPLQGKIPLVVNAESADIIASLLVLKKEVEAVKGNPIRLTLAGATEGHLIAKEIGQAGVGVLIEQRPYPSRWERKRLLPGPPLTQSSAIAKLVAHNVTVGIMVTDSSQARNTRFDMAWVRTFGFDNLLLTHVFLCRRLSNLMERSKGQRPWNLSPPIWRFYWESRAVTVILSRRKEALILKEKLSRLFRLARRPFILCNSKLICVLYLRKTGRT